MRRDQILDTAGGLISGDRDREYGDPGESFARIAALWEPILGAPVTAGQVGLCLAMLKVSRLVYQPGHVDSWVDAVGYLALGGEISLKEQRDENCEFDSGECEAFESSQDRT